MAKIRCAVERTSTPYLRVVKNSDEFPFATTVEIPDSYMAALENARKAEERAVERLLLWLSVYEPDAFREIEKLNQ